MLNKAIKQLRTELYQYGLPIQTKNWQGMENPPVFMELLNVGFESQMPETREQAELECRPFLPWANDHFAERVSGIPHNPPPSHAQWLKGNEESLKNGKFSHSYPERMHKNVFTLVELLKNDPSTRQAYLPIWWEIDGEMAANNERVPCTLGWHFILRDGFLHCYYPMRSCDALRHFHNDVYFATLLTQWLIEKAGLDAKPGMLNFHAVSFHCFENDKYALGKTIK